MAPPNTLWLHLKVVELSGKTTQGYPFSGDKLFPVSYWLGLEGGCDRHAPSPEKNG